MKKSYEYLDPRIRVRLNHGFRLFALLMQNTAKALANPLWFEEQARHIVNSGGYVRVYGTLSNFDPDQLAAQIMVSKGYLRAAERMEGVQDAFTRSGNGEQQVTVWAGRAPTGTPAAVSDWQEATLLSAAFAEFRGEYARCLRYLADYIETGKVPPTPQ